ncbi:hypothetical protein FB567DRAFT_75627 [Paraphoma chrysanthemicola]|uniref:Uncharacterized protein n=1 Tax=Paraphoma chrysanthemicola TaxID=798071 RepID=A0A8K0R1F8_9PLEO|nr:hypothetical protein FB567DRAFT_75627 [Paraphoma chrysanthemicola]
MYVSNKHMILKVFPIVAIVAVVVAITTFFIIHKRRKSRKNVLPMTKHPESAFLREHLTGLRSWEKPAAATYPATNRFPQPLKVDAGHLPFLAQPSSSHQPERSTRLTWQQYKERQHQRGLKAQNHPPPGQWKFKPKGPAYWRQVGRDMEARKSWWQKLRDKCGF